MLIRAVFTIRSDDREGHDILEKDRKMGNGMSAPNIEAR